jgi:hypothetical protein
VLSISEKRFETVLTVEEEEEEEEEEEDDDKDVSLEESSYEMTASVDKIT